jgi:hypothetical protein
MTVRKTKAERDSAEGGPSDGRRNLASRFADRVAMRSTMRAKRRSRSFDVQHRDAWLSTLMGFR